MKNEWTSAPPIDPLIWPVVKRMNETGWVWTAESCQGGHEWSAVPMLRLVCRTQDLGALLERVYATMRVGPDHQSSRDGTFVRLERHKPAPVGWSELRVWADILAYFARLTGSVGRT